MGRAIKNSESYVHTFRLSFVWVQIDKSGNNQHQHRIIKTNNIEYNICGANFPKCLVRVLHEEKLNFLVG